MQTIFKIWIIGTLLFALIAAFLIGIESIIFGFFLMPLIIICTIILVLGGVQSKKRKKSVGGGI